MKCSEPVKGFTLIWGQPWADFGFLQNIAKLGIIMYIHTCMKKSRIRETKHLSTDADSSTDTTVGWTKNTRKPNIFEKRKKSSKTQKTQKRLEICQN